MIVTRGLKLGLIALGVVIVAGLLIFICYVLIKKPFTYQSSEIANPASEHCISNGGTLNIRSNNEGQYGVCIKNGNECEEWSLLRGECSLE